MNKLLRWTLLALIALGVAFLLVGRHYILSSKQLAGAIRSELPPGSTRAQVNRFIEARHPVAYDDTGARVTARLSGRAENVIYRKDIVVTFDFDAQGRFSGYSTKEYFTFF